MIDRLSLFAVLSVAERVAISIARVIEPRAIKNTIYEAFSPLMTTPVKSSLLCC